MTLKKIITGALFAIILIAGANIAPANASVESIEGNLKAAAEQGAGFSKPQDPRTTVAVIIRTALQLIGMVFLVLLIYAGALWMLAAGNEDKIETAKNIIKAAVIGLAIVLSAYSITLFVSYVVAQRGDRSAIKVNPPQSENLPFNP